MEEGHPHDMTRVTRVPHVTPGPALPAGGLEAALEVWAYVQSRPESGRTMLTMGKRDVSFDAGMPVPLRWFTS